VAWEKRGNEREYYYKPVRIGNAPRRMYLGRGPAGRIHEILDRKERKKRDGIRRLTAELKTAIAADTRRWRELMAVLRPLIAAEMLLAGWYLHRGQWRKAMMKPRERQNAAPSPAPPLPDLLRQLHALNARANAGEASALRELGSFLTQNPEVYRLVGDLTSITMIQGLTKLSAGDPAQFEAYRQNLEGWRRELLGERPNAIERGLVDAAISAKLAMTSAEVDLQAGSPTHTIVALKRRSLEKSQFRLTQTLSKLAELQKARGYCPATTAPDPPSWPPVAQAG
jgi:hypothetical protein